LHGFEISDQNAPLTYGCSGLFLFSPSFRYYEVMKYSAFQRIQLIQDRRRHTYIAHKMSRDVKT